MRQTQVETNQEKKGKRVSVDFTAGAYDDLAELARIRGKTKAAIIRDALSLEKWFQETQQTGGRVLVEHQGKAREIIRR